jgi:serine protease Do
MNRIPANKLTLALSIVAAATIVPLPSLAGGEKMWTENGAEGDLVQMPSLGPLVKKVGGAVLTIHTEVELGSSNRPDPTDPGFELFKRFGLEFDLPQMPRMQGQGTGFLISPDGYALTNNHVIENADVIKVRVGYGKKEHLADVVGTDPKTDVALIKLRGKRNDWPVIPLGDSDALEVGDFAVAMGNPFGLSQSVSMGIISARSRRDIMPSGRQGLYDFLQTDASINPGNSGGPLLNLRGEVIGINTAINAAGQGLGFAIPINLVKQLAPQLKKEGRVSRSWIGVSIRQITPPLAEGLGLKKPRGALVAMVVSGGPAERAGIEPGDVITRFDDKPIDDANELPLLAGLAGVGKKVKLELLRDGKRKTLSVKLEELPGDKGRRASSKKKDDVDEHAGRLGVTVQDLTPKLRRRVGVSATTMGVHVVRVRRGSAAEEGGLQTNDVILEVSGKKVRNASAFARAVRSVKSGKLVRLLVQRNDNRVFVPVIKP